MESLERDNTGALEKMQDEMDIIKVVGLDLKMEGFMEVFTSTTILWIGARKGSTRESRRMYWVWWQIVRTWNISEMVVVT